MVLKGLFCDEVSTCEDSNFCVFFQKKRETFFKCKRLHFLGLIITFLKHNPSRLKLYRTLRLFVCKYVWVWEKNVKRKKTKLEFGV